MCRWRDSFQQACGTREFGSAVQQLTVDHKSDRQHLHSQNVPSLPPLQEPLGCSPACIWHADHMRKLSPQPGVLVVLKQRALHQESRPAVVLTSFLFLEPWGQLHRVILSKDRLSFSLNWGEAKCYRSTVVAAVEAFACSSMSEQQQERYCDEDGVARHCFSKAAAGKIDGTNADARSWKTCLSRQLSVPKW